MTKQKTRTNSKLNKQKEIEQRKRKHRKIIFILVVLVAIIVGICSYLLTANVFNIQYINIKGNKQLSQEDIYELSGIKIGDNIFSTLEIVTRVKLKQNGYIEDVKINKIYPDKIELEVKERQKEFQIQTETGCYIYIDDQGHILDYSLEKLELPTIIGMEMTEDKIKEIKRLEENDLEKMENILQIRFEAKNIELADKITQFQVQDEYILSLENEGIIINLGNATNLKNRMYYVKAILAKELGNTGTIYVNGNLDEGFIPYFSAN